MKLKTSISIIISIIFFLSCAAQEKKQTKTAEVKTTVYKKNTFITLTVNPELYDIELYNTTDNKLSNKEILASKEELIFAVNAGKKSDSELSKGLLLKNGTVISYGDQSLDSGDFKDHKGIFLLSKKYESIIEYSNKIRGLNPKNYTLAVESSPILVSENKIDENLKKDTTKRTLSGVGINSDGHIVFIISKKALQYHEFAAFFKKKMKCTAAFILEDEDISYFSKNKKLSSKESALRPMLVISKKSTEEMVQPAAIQEEKLSKEIKLITFLNKKYIVCEIDTKNYELELFNKNDQKKVHTFKSIDEQLKAQEHIFSFNAGMYDKQRNPLGLYINKGEKVTDVNLQRKGYGNFYSLPPNGIFLINDKGVPKVVTTEYYVKNKKSLGKIITATQSGPMMVIEGKFNKAFNKGSTNLNIRNGIGVSKKGKIFLVISEEHVNFYEFSELFRDHLKCDNALYFDGVVSQWYAPKVKEQITNKYTLGTFLTVKKK